MNKEYIILIVIIVLNTLCALLYTVIALLSQKREERIKILIQGTVIFICPVIGAGYLLLSWAALKLFFKKPLDYSDVSFSDSRVKTLLAPDYVREINTVPVEEAIAVSDKNSLRHLLLDILKNDREHSLPAVMLSLHSTDSETSHYAASVLTDVISEFSKTASSLRAKFREDPEANVKDGVELVVLILYYLEAKLFSSIQAKTYLATAEQTAQTIYEADPLLINETVMLSMTEAYLSVSDTSGAEVWAARLGRHYPQTLQRYTASLKYYYAAGERDEFFSLLEELKKSSVAVNYDILMLIRLFDAEKK